MTGARAMSGLALALLLPLVTWAPQVSADALQAAAAVSLGAPDRGDDSDAEQFRPFADELFVPTAPVSQINAAQPADPSTADFPVQPAAPADSAASQPAPSAGAPAASGPAPGTAAPLAAVGTAHGTTASAAPDATPGTSTTLASGAAKPVPQVSSQFSREELEPLLRTLATDGYPRDTLESVFYDKRLRRIDRVITFNVMNPDSASMYEQFLSPFALKLAKKFKQNHAPQLTAVEARTGVSKDVIVAILLVETQFGTAEERYRLLEVFTTLIVDAHPDGVDRHFARMKAAYPALTRDYLEQRLTKKAGWAYEELKALLAIRERLNVPSLYEVKGSYAGAFGMPQFMPTSYAQWAVDGNQDRQVDLDNPQDAMASIANFLGEHGWKPTATLEQKMRAVWEYNHSEHYVQTIFDVALGVNRPFRKIASRQLPPEPPQTAALLPPAASAATPAAANGSITGGSKVSGGGASGGGIALAPPEANLALPPSVAPSAQVGSTPY